MNKYLQSADHFTQIARLDGDELHFLSKKEVNDFDESLICGRYSIIDDCPVTLCRGDSGLMVGVGSQKIALDGHVSSELNEGMFSNRLVLMNGDKELLSFKYKRKAKTAAERIDPTPFVEAEDFDFCLFVKNIVNDPARQMRVFNRSQANDVTSQS